MEIRCDILGVIPEIGDIIIFNPPKYKGLIFGDCMGFTKVGLPKVGNLNCVMYPFEYDYKRDGFYVPKTGFICKSKEIYV